MPNFIVITLKACPEWMGRAENWTSDITKQSWAISFFFLFPSFHFRMECMQNSKRRHAPVFCSVCTKLNYKAIETHKDHPRSNNLHAIQWYKKDGKKRESVWITQQPPNNQNLRQNRINRERITSRTRIDGCLWEAWS